MTAAPTTADVAVDPWSFDDLFKGQWVRRLLLLAALGLLQVLVNFPKYLSANIDANLPPGVHILDLVARLHPTPAVGGSPQTPALAALQRLEAFPRGLYAGPQGWVDHRGGGEFFVGIRSALIDGCTATAYAGAGIVAGSEPEKEFAETELKFKALLEALTQS